MSLSKPEQPSTSREEVALRVNQFRFSVDLFKRNHEELSVFLTYFSAPEVAFSYSPVEQKWLWHEGMKEVSFLLHNFVAAALTLVDHTRVLYNQLYEPQQLIPEYTEQIEQRFISDPLTQFVIKLRQMAQHYRLPSIYSHTEFRDDAVGAKVRIELRLTAADLRKFSSWNAAAKQFLDEAGETINIGELIERYFAHVMNFYDWFDAEQKKIHGIAPDIYAHLLTHGAVVGPRKEIAELENNVSQLEQKARDELTIADMEITFAPVLTVLDFRKLMLCRHNGPLWVRTALSTTEARFQIPEDLRTRILRIIEG